MYIDNTADLVLHLYWLKNPALVKWNCSYCAGLSAVGRSRIKFLLGIYISVVPCDKFVISVLVSFVCVCVCVCTCVSLSQSKDMVKCKFRAVLSYSWVAGVLISAVVLELLSLPPLGRSRDPASLLSSGVWYCLEDEVIARVENVWSYASTSFFHIHTVHLDIIKVFWSPTDAQVNCLKNNFKICIKIDIKRAPTCFSAVTIIREHIQDC
jgi:hypothetical protein